MDTSFAFETFQGVLVGITFALGAFLVTRLPKYRWTAASILIILITPLALLPFWFSYGDLGISDWDYYLSMHTNLQRSITDFHQFPLWNPYTCGGTSALGDPEFPVFSPLFLLELLFGTHTGIRLSIFVSTAVGALGMLHLARKIGIGVVGGLVASLAMAFGSVNLLEIVEGHQNILAAMYIPWVLYCWYTAYLNEGKKRILSTILVAILLALMFFQGGIYLLMYMTGVFVLLPFFVKNKKNAILVTCLAGVLALGLASVKLIPVALWIQEFQDTAYASSAYTLANLDDIFLGRILYGAEDIIPNQGGGWHEYGAYIGPVILLLAILGFIFNLKKRVVRTLFVFAILATIISATGPYLKPLFDQLSFIPRSNVSRIILFAVIPLSLLAGFGIESIQKKSRAMHMAALILLTLASIDIMSMTYPLSSQAFVLPHVTNTIPQAPYPIAYSPYDYKTRYKGVDYTRAYDATLKGYGNMTYCSVLGPNPAVELITDEGTTGILSLPDDKNATFTIGKWSPNRVTVQIQATQKTDVILNTNYAKGWFINGKPAKEIRNRPGTNVEAGSTMLEFSYIPSGMYVGIAITLIAILVLIYSSLKSQKDLSRG